MKQRAEPEWHEQWSMMPAVDRDEERLLRDWIHPLRLEDLEGRTVLEAGCGSGQHTRMFARFARRVVAADLNTAGLARSRLAGVKNVEVVRADIARMRFDPVFDVVVCIGVIHHTADPDATFANLASLVKPGGRLVIWCYAHEGNALVRGLVEPFKRAFLRRASRKSMWTASAWLTAAMYLPIYTVYALPLPLPMSAYFANWRTLSFAKNRINVFDKLNAPTTHFITRERAARWFAGFERVHLSPYAGVSWRASGCRIGAS